MQVWRAYHKTRSLSSHGARNVTGPTQFFLRTCINNAYGSRRDNHLTSRR